MSVPGDNSGRWRLPERLCELSQNKRWPNALDEWQLDHVYMLEKEELTDNCICSHWIREVCVVTNEKNGNEAKIGNCCIRLFEKEALDASPFKGMQTVSDCLKRMKENRDKAPNAALVNQAFRKGVLNDWEKSFCEKTAKTRKLTDAQKNTRRSINEKILLGICTSAAEALSQITKDPTCSANPKLIDKALEKKVIREQDAVFLRSKWTLPHRILSDKQKSYKVSLNQKIVQNLKLS